jgi:hypothetical protein
MSESTIVKAEELDQFGRTEAERTVVLSSLDAELLNREVELGNHQTFDGTLSYVLSYGFSTLATRHQQKALRDARTELGEIMRKHAQFSKMQPELAKSAKYIETHNADVERVTAIIEANSSSKAK